MEFYSDEIWEGRASNNKLVTLGEHNEDFVKSREIEEITREDIYRTIKKIKHDSELSFINELFDKDYIFELNNFAISTNSTKKGKTQTHVIKIAYDVLYDDELNEYLYEYVVENDKLISFSVNYITYEGLLKILDVYYETKITYGIQNLEMPNYKLYQD